MYNADRYFFWRIFTMLIAMALSILPLPVWASYIWPNWLLFTLCVWLMIHPNYLCLSAIWCMGLFMDLLLASPLGLHAFGFVIVAYLIMRWYRQLLHFPIWQQTLAIGLFTLIVQVLAIFCHLLFATSISFKTLFA